jgi:hypothetical protein
VSFIAQTLHLQPSEAILNPQTLLNIIYTFTVADKLLL